MARPYRLYSAADLDILPPQQWVVKDRIPDNGLVAVIGGKGTLKTFIVLDLVCHIVLGLPWHGRETARRRVLYVYAEGPFGAKARLDAWCAYMSYLTGRTITRADLALWLLPVRVPVNNPIEVAALLAEIRQLPETPQVVVIDTLNSNLDGDEDGKGMGAFVAGCAMLREALPATVIAVHHTPLGTDDRGRGHSAFDGAVDTRLIVSRDADRVTLECTHQRNGPDGWSVAFETVPIAGSLALKPSAPNAGALKGQRRAILELVHSDGPLACTTWKNVSELSPSSFHKARRWLLANGYVKLEKQRYAATDAGRLALSTPGAPGGAP
jgi:hypothetical protein